MATGELQAHYGLMLGLVPPWAVLSVNLDWNAKRLVLEVEYPRGHRAPCPEPGCGEQCSIKDHREERSWRQSKAGAVVARTQHLPLYSAAFVFVREIYKIRVKLPRLLKHDLGQEVFQSAIKILKCVVLANRAREKSRHITRLLLETEVQWAMLRLLFDLKGITEGEFKILSARLGKALKCAKDFAFTLRGTRSTSSPPPISPVPTPLGKASSSARCARSATALNVQSGA